MEHVSSVARPVMGVEMEGKQSMRKKVRVAAVAAADAGVDVGVE